MFNYSKTRQKPQKDASNLKDAPDFQEEQFQTIGTGNSQTELICGYLFNNTENKLYTISGTHQDGKLSLRKTEMKVGMEGIIYWTAYLIHMEQVRVHPARYSDLLENLASPNPTKPDKEPPASNKPAPDDVSFKSYGNAGVSEVSAHFDGSDLVVQTKTTLKGGRTHVRKDGLTNYLVNALREMIIGAADQAFTNLKKKVDAGEGTDAELIMLWS